LRPPAVPQASLACGRPCRRSGFAVRFPGLLDRYVARKFLALWALILAALVIIAFAVTFFESLNDALQRGKPVALLIRYVWFALPEYLSFILPASVLMAALLALGVLARTNEATAMKAAGVSAYRTAVPVLVLALGVGGLAFLIQERVVPAAHAKHEAAWSALNGLPPRISSFLNRHWVLAGNADRIYHYDYFDPGPSAFGRLSVFEIDPARWVLARRVFADKAVFDGGELVYRDAWIRDFGDAPGRPFIRSAGGRLDAAADQNAFRTRAEEPLQMTLGDLRRYTAEVRAMGFPAVRLRAELAQKVALPFVSLIMALLAVPFGYGLGRKGALVGIGFGVVTAMVYWGTYAVFRSLGGAGVLPPFLGAWGANALFGLAGITGMFRLRT
jgi:LPS export ABC transporter permease LptG